MIRRPPRSTLFPLHDALPISSGRLCPPVFAADDSAPVVSSARTRSGAEARCITASCLTLTSCATPREVGGASRSEEHTSELQSRQYLVCRLLLEKKKKLCLNS